MSRHSDSAILAAEPTFVARVRVSLVNFCGTVSEEDWAVPFHRERQTYSVAVLNQPSSYESQFSTVVSTNVTVLDQATDGNTVPLTPQNVAAQAAKVQDDAIDGAVSRFYNGFFRTPGQ